MKTLTLCLFVLLSLSASASEIKRSLRFKDFAQAKSSETRLQFIVESTKAAVFSSDVDGYVKDFSYSAELDEKNLILRNMKITFMSKSMDTDNESRDEKLHNLCMGHEQYPKVVVTVKGPVFLKGARPRVYRGVVDIRGKEKAFDIKLWAKKKKNGRYLIQGSAVWSLERMGIPDPSILVASLSDEIRINISINEKFVK